MQVNDKTLMEKKICKHIECQSEEYFQNYCKFHYEGGIFGSGDTYEQYQVIEQDFIDFIKIIPLNDHKNLEVCSPVLRDLIIRCCVQIEIFFKEWAKYICSESESNEFWELYNVIDKKSQNPKGVRNWTFKNYYYFINNVSRRKLHVRDLDKDINPFENWTAESPPNWWKVYNSIKHSGAESKRESNLEIALYSLAALFQLHCANDKSRKYLEQYLSITATRKTFSKNLTIKFDKIKTPLDSKKYLFMDIYSTQRSFEVITSSEARDRANGKGYNV